MNGSCQVEVTVDYKMNKYIARADIFYEQVVDGEDLDGNRGVPFVSVQMESIIEVVDYYTNELVCVDEDQIPEDLRDEIENKILHDSNVLSDIGSDYE